MPAWHATVYLDTPLNDAGVEELAAQENITAVVSSPAQGATQVRVRLTAETWQAALDDVGPHVRAIESRTGFSATQIVVTDETTAAAAIGLIGPAEAAALMGISTRRFRQLREERPDFPEPALVLEQGPLWTAAAIAEFHRWRPKDGGRPRKDDDEG